MKKHFIGLALTLITISGFAQSSSEIYHQIKKFNSFKSALYMAAHPDDENTRVIAWLENGELARTGYLSLTRGDGGQNLIGKELGAELGVLRTQELLAARNIDGGEQFFTRAVDFGYSKSADESFEKWNREDILHDAVWVIRNFKPEVIITRFPPDRRGGHGHHTASAMLAIEAYEKAADPNAFPEQLKFVDVWQTQAVYWNASTWWNKKLDSLAANNEDYIVADIGGYDELLGVNYNELGTMARSQHKCQGFGVRIERGERKEYFQWLTGDKLKSDFFENSLKDWSSFENGKALTKLSIQLEKEFDFQDPSKSIAVLLDMQDLINQMKDTHWKNQKMRECDALLQQVAGLHIEFLAEDYTVNAGDKLNVKLEIINRGNGNLKMSSAGILGKEVTVENYDYSLEKNKVYKEEMVISAKNELSNPYWLNAPFTTQYQIEDRREIGKPENDAALSAYVGFVNEEGRTFTLVLPVEYKWSDRVKGEMKRLVYVTPKYSTSFLEKSFVFKSGDEKEIAVTVKNYNGPQNVEVSLSLPEGWKSLEAVKSISFEKKYEEQVISFKVQSPKNESKGEIEILLNNKPGLSVNEIMYDHIPAQLVYMPSKATVLNLYIEINVGLVGYIEGAGDQVALAIEQMGYQVEVLSKEDLGTKDLSKYKAIVTGIRAYNVHPWLTDLHGVFMEYVKGGGNFIVQYNTRSSSYGTDKMGPYPFKISRDRVSEEDAEVTIINPKHDLLNSPNKITIADFEGWVQERGLYFPNEWAEEYEVLFRWNDKGESPKDGALIYANYGEGNFMYSGISFFRELPAGVPGAFKLLANMISCD